MPTILVVDDASSIRMLVRANLQLAGFTVDEATDGLECVEMLRANPGRYDGVLADVMMPRLTGLDAVETIRAEAELNHVWVVLMSTQAADLEHAESIGADGYLIKPFDPDRMVAVINTLLGSADADLWSRQAIEAGRAATQRRSSSTGSSPAHDCDDSLDS